MAGQCQGQNQRGGACSATPQRGTNWCLWHDPSLVAKRQAWNVAGGKSRSNAARARKALADEAMDLQDVSGLLSRLLRRLEAGQVEPAVATASANLARALATLQQVTAIEDRIAELERAAGVTDRQGGASA